MAITRSATPLEVDDTSLSSTDSTPEPNNNQDNDAQIIRKIEFGANSAYNYQFKDGRRYHAYDPSLYLLPNDNKEQNRLNVQHQIFRLSIDGALTLTPATGAASRALDIGCGTGIWAIEFAEENPKATVVGVDLSPIQPLNAPANCSFKVSNVESEWDPNEKYDFIHSRAMVGGIRSWPHLLAQTFKHLNPGGYVELQDVNFPSVCVDPNQKTESKFFEWTSSAVEGTHRIGLDLQAPEKWPELLETAGFVDINVMWVNWPIGPWAKGDKYKIMGRLALEDFGSAIGATFPIFMALGWTAEKAQELIHSATDEIEAQNVLSSQRICFCYARKPVAV